jgi:hypothetical protein
LEAEVLGRYPRVDVLINARAKYTSRQVTNDGIEMTGRSIIWRRMWSKPTADIHGVATAKPTGTVCSDCAAPRDQRGTSAQGEALKLAYEIVAPTPELGRR